MNSRALLICNICTNFLNDPIYLPCHCSICKYHLDEKSSHTIECNFCRETFVIPVEGFRENKKAKFIIETEGHLSDEEKQLKQDVVTSSLYLENLFDQFKMHESEFEMLHDIHFGDLKKNIALRSSLLKAKIDEIVNDMMNKLASSEQLYNDHKASNKTFTSQEQFKRELDKFRHPNLSINKIEVLKIEQDKYIDELRMKLEEIAFWKKGLESYRLSEFNCEKRILKKLFGFMRQSHTTTTSTSTISTPSNLTSVNNTNALVKTEILMTHLEFPDTKNKLSNYPVSDENNNTDKLLLPNVLQAKEEIAKNDASNSIRVRQVLNMSQKRELEALFKINSRPNQKTVLELSAKINVSSSRVSNWFMNRRNKEKNRRHLPNFNNRNKTRKSKTRDQLEQLELLFSSNSNPSNEEIKKLSEKVDLSRKCIYEWFCNKRRKLLKDII